MPTDNLFFLKCSNQVLLLYTVNLKHTHLYLLAAAAAKSLQSCPTLCDPTDGSPPGSAVPGILQARTLEWVAIYPLGATLFEAEVEAPLFHPACRWHCRSNNDPLLTALLSLSSTAKYHLGCYESPIHSKSGTDSAMAGHNFNL